MIFIYLPRLLSFLMSVEIDRISKSYGTQKALDEVSFRIGSGEILGLIGPNGAGKSTLMKILCGLFKPDSGCIRINGEQVEYTNNHRLKMGYLPEHNPLYPEMYVIEYLHYVARLYHLRSAAKQVDRVVEQTGLGPEQHKRIGQLSKGYRQRVGLAQSIVHNPEILVLDEPTTGLDPNQLEEIRTLIGNLGNERIVILSTHIMQEVEAICKRVVLLNKGKIAANELTGKLTHSLPGDSHTLVVEFTFDPADGFFSSVAGILNARQFKQGTWLIDFRSDTDIREALFNAAVKSNLVILSMHRKDKKLEEVFRELTS